MFNTDKGRDVSRREIVWEGRDVIEVVNGLLEPGRPRPSFNSRLLTPSLWWTL